MMTARERSELQTLMRQREKVLKAAAKQRSADLLADFENQLGTQWSFDQDEVWRAAQRRWRDRHNKATAVTSRPALRNATGGGGDADGADT